ncbi:MAG: hypothetical protein V8Q79_10890 [Christensenellales bacterium]
MTRARVNGSSRVDMLVKAETDHGRRVYMDYRRNPAGFALETSTEAREYLTGAARCSDALERLRINAPAIELYRAHGIDLETKCWKSAYARSTTTAAWAWTAIGRRMRPGCMPAARRRVRSGEPAGRHGAQQHAGRLYACGAAYPLPWRSLAGAVCPPIGAGGGSRGTRPRKMAEACRGR